MIHGICTGKSVLQLSYLTVLFMYYYGKVTIPANMAYVRDTAICLPIFVPFVIQMLTNVKGIRHTVDTEILIHVARISCCKDSM